MELFECDRLSAKISQAACDSNKKRGVYACETCFGLGVSAKIDTEEISMGTKGTPCNEPGCKTQSWKGGKCWKHHPGHAKNKQVSREDKQEISRIHREAAAATEPPVTDHEIHVVNLVELFKAKQQVELENFIAGLSELSADPLKRLEWTYRRVCMFQ